MRAGSLDRSITLERRSETVSDAGTVTESWAALTTMRAERVEVSSDEANTETGKSEVVRMTFRTRYFAGLTTDDRLVFDGQAFDIVGIDEIGRRRGLLLRVERRP